MSGKNPYTQATESYTLAGEKSGRDLEAAVLLKSSIKMELLAKKMKGEEKATINEIGDVLDSNQKIWQIFLENMMDDNFPLPQDIKNNVANLALFIFKRTNEIFSTHDPDKIQALIDINRNIATGLSKNPAPTAQTSSKEKPENTPPATSLDSNV